MSQPLIQSDKLVLLSNRSTMKVAFFAILAAASSALAATNECCDSTTTAGAPGIAELLASIGVVAQGANVPIGLGCSPITVLIYFLLASSYFF